MLGGGGGVAVLGLLGLLLAVEIQVRARLIEAPVFLAVLNSRYSFYNVSGGWVEETSTHLLLHSLGT